MAELEGRLDRLEGPFQQVEQRLHTLQWLVGLSMAWQTLLIGAAVGVLLTSR